MWPVAFLSSTINRESCEFPESARVPLFGFISMMSHLSLLWPFLIYWLVMFVACFVVIEIAQDQLYDEVTPHVGLEGHRRFGR